MNAAEAGARAGTPVHNLLDELVEPQGELAFLDARFCIPSCNYVEQAHETPGEWF